MTTKSLDFSPRGVGFLCACDETLEPSPDKCPMSGMQFKASGDPLKFFHEPLTPQGIKLILGPGEPLRVFELERGQSWSYTSVR